MSYLNRLRAKIQAADPRPAVKRQLGDEDEEPIAAPPKKRKKVPEKQRYRTGKDGRLIPLGDDGKPRFSLKDDDEQPPTEQPPQKKEEKPAEPGKFALKDLGDEPEAPQPGKKDAPAPKKDEEQPQPDQPGAPQPNKKDKPKDPEYGEVPAGQSHGDREGRYGEIKQFKPYLFIVSGVDAQSELMTFMKNVQSILNNPDVCEKIAGPDSVSGKAKNPLELTFAYLIAERVMKELVDKAFKGLQAQAVDFGTRMGQARPFDAIKLNAESKLGGQAKDFRTQMQESYIALRSKDEGESIGAVAAFQMQSLIPLDYMRWFKHENSKHDFYMGGYPEGAGRVGLIYVLCSEEESKTFLRMVKEFKPPPNFVDEMHFISNIDSGFKPTKPRSATPDNCIILTAKRAFQPTAPVSEKMKTAASAEVKSKFSPFGAKKAQEPSKGATVLDALTNMAQELGGQTPAQYVEGRLVKGNLLVHFSADMKRCVLWCGHKSMNLTPEQEKDLTEMFDLEGIDTTFSK